MDILNKYSKWGLVFTGLASIVYLFYDSVLIAPFYWHHLPESLEFIMFEAMVSTWLKGWGFGELSSLIVIVAVYLSHIISTNLVRALDVIMITQREMSSINI